jgi:hypothetical protein
MECRRHVVNESSNKYQANASMTNDNGLSIAFGGYLSFGLYSTTLQSKLNLQ